MGLGGERSQPRRILLSISPAFLYADLLITAATGIVILILQSVPLLVTAVFGIVFIAASFGCTFLLFRIGVFERQEDR